MQPAFLPKYAGGAREPTKGGGRMVPQPVKYVLETLERAGFAACAVGGCVRDTLLGRVPSDWDVTTAARPEQVLSVARRVLPAERGTVIDRDYGAEEPTDAAAPYAEKRMEVSMPTFLLGFKCPPQHGGEAQHRFTAIGELACDVLMGESSPLYARLYSQGLINGSFGSAFDILPGAAYVYAGGDSKDPKAVAEAVLAEAQRLASEGVDGDYYKRIVNANFGAALRGLNSFESIAVSMAEGHFQSYDPYRFPEIYDSITVEDVLAFLRDNFTRQHMALSVIAPSEEV